MISPSNTSPRLTSDLAGNSNADHHPGYFRTASNGSPPGTRSVRLRVQPAGTAERSHCSRRRPVHLRPRGGVRRCVLGAGGHRTVPGRNRKGPNRHDGRARGLRRHRPGRHLLPALRDGGIGFCRPGPGLRRPGRDDPDFRGRTAGRPIPRDTAIRRDLLRGTGSRLPIQRQRGDRPQRASRFSLPTTPGTAASPCPPTGRTPTTPPPSSSRRSKPSPWRRATCCTSTGRHSARR